MKATQTNAIKRIIKNANRTDLNGIFTDASGRVCACDGFRAIRLTHDTPEGLPAAQGLPIDKFFDVTYGWDLLAPTVPELQAIIKKAKEKKQKPVYDFGEDLPAVNAKYLLDMLRIFPDATIYRSSGKAPKNKAIFFESAHGDGLLLPLYKR